jgi:hypothetical protein
MAFAIRLAALCVLVLAVAGAGHAEPLSTFLDRMRTASGQPYRAHLTSALHVTVAGDTLRVTNDSAGLRFSSRECNGAICAGTYFDGTRLFSVNINGTALPQSTATETYLRGLRTASSLSFLSPAFENDGGRIEDGGTTTVGHRRYRELLVVSVDAVAMQVFVDPQTALISFVRDVNGDSVIEYGDYRRVGAFMLPFAVRRNGNPAETYDARTASTESFEPPRGLAPTLVRGAPPMNTDPTQASPVGQCTLAGVTVKCLIDTGNSGLAMSLDLAERLQLAPIGSYEVLGLGHYATEVVRAGPLRAGNALFPEANYVVLHDIHRYGYDLVLGADVLANTSVEIDAATHTVTFGEPAPESESSIVPIAFENFVPVVAVHFGNIFAPLALDTGDDSNINLAYDFYTRHPDLFTATAERTVSGIGGDSVELLGEIPSVRIGGYRLSAQSIGTTRTLRGTAFGHVGAAFLEHFKVHFDYAKSEITLVPHPGDNSIERVPPGTSLAP